MVHKNLSIITALGLMIALAACGSPAATTAPQPGQPTVAPASEAAAPATPAATDQALSGGLVPQGGAMGPDAITADNLTSAAAKRARRRRSIWRRKSATATWCAA